MSRLRGPSVSKLKVSLLTNMVAPYRVPVLSAISADPRVSRLRVLICTEREVDREWQVSDVTSYEQHVVAGVTLNLRHGSDGRRILHFRFGLLWELISHRPDWLIIGDASWTSFLAAGLCRFYRIPYVIWNEITTSSRVSTGVASRLRLWMYRGAERFLASGKMAQDFLTENGVELDLITIANNSVDNNFYLTQRSLWEPERDRLRREMGIAEGAFCFIYVGQLISRKRIIETVELLADTASVRPVHLIVAGSGALEAEARARAAEKSFGAITFCGYTDPEQLSQLYVAADALILLSSDDPWGMVINEILLFGKGYIATTEVGAATEMEDGARALCLPFEQIGPRTVVDYVEAYADRSPSPQVPPPSPHELAATILAALR